jgi:hypothetical protein
MAKEGRMTASRAAEDYLAAVGGRLAADGCDPRWEDWTGARVLVGRRADFRLSWFATRLHLFTVAAAVPEVTVPVIDAFTRNALRYAKENKGGLPRGLQTGSAVFPVLVSERVDEAAVAWAEEKQRALYACFGRPVVADVARRRVSFYRKRHFLGWVYASHLVGKGDGYFRPQGWA